MIVSTCKSYVANLKPGKTSDLRPDRKWPEFVTVVGNDSEAATAENDYLGGENLRGRSSQPINNIF